MATAQGSLHRRLTARVTEFWPSGRAGWALLALLVGGLVVRAVAIAAWWPATTTLADAWPYSSYAQTGLFDNPQHPAGYTLLLAGIGVFTREVAVTIAIQHLLGIAAGLLLFAGVRRLAGSPWPALVPAGVVLLGADQIYLEHSVMSEGPFVFFLALSAYAAVRAIDAPSAWGWALAAGLAAALATGIRAAGVFLIPILIVALVLSRPRPWLPAWRAPVALLAGAALLLVPYATSIVARGDSLGVAPSSGWHLYHRVAPIADCSQFEPPEGTESLCERTSPDGRPGGDFYLFDTASPAIREYGFMGNSDREVGAFARKVVLNQPGDYVETVAADILAYYVPSSHEEVPYSGTGLDPSLDWAVGHDPSDPLAARTQRDTEAGMEVFFDDFSVTKRVGVLDRLHDYQRVFRFGALALTIATLLTLAGLVAGDRRLRVGILLYGVGGLALLAAPTLSGIYVGRYTVPLAGLLAAGAALGATALWRRYGSMRPRRIA